MKKQLVLALILILFSISSFPALQTTQPQAKLVRKAFKRGDFIAVAQEAALDLKAYANGSSDMVAIRVCSKSPLPLALTQSLISPLYMLSYLEHYGFSQERILFLRSVDCLSDDPTITTTEFWAIPQGASLPPSVETIKSCQAKSQLVGTESPIKSEQVFRQTLQEFTVKLRLSSKALGVVTGYYYQSPNTIMKRKIRDTKRFMERKGISRDRYFINLQIWPGENDVDSTKTEPMYPELEIIEIFKDCK
jgi:hypothetical protein